MYDKIFDFEKSATTKDGKKGEKDAIKAIKKIETLDKDTIMDIMDSVYKRTTNTDYIAGFVDICRQAMMSIDIVA